MMLVTGAHGFLGWHLRVRLRALYDVVALPIGRNDFVEGRLASRLDGVETVIHLAAVNRADSDEAVEDGNVEIAQQLAEAIISVDRPIHLVYGNSIQASVDSPYGRGKAEAGRILRNSVEKVGGTFADILLPNLFGEHGKPHYNSFVATFCSEIAQGRQPVVTGDKPVPLLHAQQAANVLATAASLRETHRVEPLGEERRVSVVLDQLEDFHAKYRQGQVPALSSPFDLDLFNSYRSHMFPAHFPFQATVSADQRGELFEAVRSHGGTGQTFVSTTRPGITRGEHFHLRKVERFFVVRGTAEISLRRLFDDEIVRFTVSGDQRSFVDMPTMWVHNIKNIGEDELTTLFWTDQLLNPAAPDTYWEAVDLVEDKAP